jgi:hypothetical protein
MTPDPVKFYAFLGNIGTFSISVACMSFADFLLLEEKQYRGNRALWLFLLMAISVVLSAMSLILRFPVMHYIAISGMVLALLEWIFVHWKDPVFVPENEFLAPLGGNPQV